MPDASLQNIFDSLSHLEHSQIFCGATNHTATCSDERIVIGSIHIPGAGILTRDPVATARLLKNIGITELTSHENCGAAAAAHTAITFELKTSPDLQPPAWFVASSSEETARQFVAKTVESLKTIGVPAVEHHLTFDNGGMVGDCTVHHATVIYYDIAGRGFNQYAAPGKLPLGFVITAIPNEETTNLGNIEAVVGIAFGKNGKPKFYQHTPLKIALLTTEQNTPDILPKINHALAAKFPKQIKQITVETVQIHF